MTVDNTKKKNILIVHNYYQIPGGEDTVVANEKKMLEKHGHKVILYSRNNAELKQMSKLQKAFLPVTTVFNPRTYRDIKKLISKEKIEVVHVHNTLNLVSPAVYYAARRMKVPVVQTIHNFRLLCPGATFYRDGHICEDCVEYAKLIYGLRQDCTKKEMQKALAEGTVMKYLQKVPIHKDDLFFIPAGTIHAIGAGALVAEIQESSNLTYRLYDYDRIGKDGKKRELHIDKALDVADLHGSAEPRQPLRVLKYRPGMASELLIRCKYFEVYRMLINTERRQTVHYRADRMAFRVLLCMDGCGTISYDEGTVNFYKGDCVFVPADSEVLTIHGQAQFLDIRG